MTPFSYFNVLLFILIWPIHFRLYRFLCILCRFCRKDKCSFSPFQHGVHPLPEKMKFLFSLNNLKRSLLLISSLQSILNAFLFTYIFEEFIRNTVYLHIIWTVLSVFFEFTEYELISEIKILKILTFFWQLRRYKKRLE